MWTARLLLAIAGGALAGCVTAGPGTSWSEPEEEPSCQRLADPARSTFVLFEVRTKRLVACNSPRAAQRFVPASTYKIAHALAAIENGVVSDESRSFAWDGRPRGISAWDRDTSLAEGIAASTVWVFQRIARQLGHAREAQAVKRYGYGNGDVGVPGDIAHFWLSGPLAISALEQVRFLASLREGRLDADPASQGRVAAMLRMRECGPGCVVYGKTGAVLPIDDEGFLKPNDPSLLPAENQRVGWFVGWVERPDAQGGPIVFAHNLDLAIPGAMKARTEVAYELLSAHGVPLLRPE